MDNALESDEIAAQLGSLDGWEHRDDALCKRFVFTNFITALGFMQSSGIEIDKLDHHPEWANLYNRVDVRLTTHSAGNRVTVKDFAVAAILDRHSARAGAA